MKYSIPYVSLVVYFILLIMTEFIIETQKNKLYLNKQVIRWASFSGLLIFFGLRGFIGWDWYIYYPTFKDIPSLLSFKEGIFTTTRFEYGFAFYMSIIKSVWNNFHFFIFLNTLIDLLILNAIILRYAKYSYSFTCLLFLVMGGFYLETDLLRSAKTIMIFLLSLKYIEERKMLQFFLLNIVGCLFHISAVLYLPMYFVLQKVIPRKVVVIIFIAGLAVFLLKVEYIRPFLVWAASILGERFTILLNKYLDISAYSTEYGITIGFLERIITATILIIYYDKLQRDNKKNLIFINCYIIYFIFFFYFAEIKIIPVRIGGLFAFAYWVLYPALIRVIEKKNNRAILISSFFIYSLIKIEGMTDTILYNYVNVLFYADDFPSRVKIFESSLHILMR